MPAKANSDPPEMIEPGKRAPAFSLKDQDGNAHRLSDYLGRWVVLYFYPRDNTPGCTIQACGFRDRYEELNASNAVVFGVSPDDEKAHKRFVQKRELPFALLVDPGQKVASKYGVWRQKTMFGVKHMGIVRTTYLIGPDGQVARRWDKVKVAGHARDVSDTITELS